MSRSIDTIFSFINSSLPSPLNADDYILGLPQFHNLEINTKVLIRPKLSTGKYGNFWFYYNRVDMETLDDLEVNKNDATSLHQIFDQLNAIPRYFLSIKAYGNTESSKIPGFLYEEEFMNQQIPNIGFNAGITMALKPIANSYLFAGQTTVFIKKTP